VYSTTWQNYTSVNFFLVTNVKNFPTHCSFSILLCLLFCDVYVELGYDDFRFPFEFFPCNSCHHLERQCIYTASLISRIYTLFSGNAHRLSMMLLMKLYSTLELSFSLMPSRFLFALFIMHDLFHSHIVYVIFIYYIFSTFICVRTD